MENYTIDCTDLQDPRQLHQRLHSILCFPEWYGHNLDALYDCLTERRTDYRILLQGWPATANWASDFEAVFADAQEDNPHLQVMFH